MRKAKILETVNTNFPYNVQIWIDGCYCGIGKFCRSLSEAVEYAEMHADDFEVVEYGLTD